MKKTLTLAFALCLALCACTGKTELSGSFICGDADAYAVCDNGFFTAKAGSVKCFDSTGNVSFERELELMPAHITQNAALAAAYAEGGRSVVYSDGEVIIADNEILCARLSEKAYLALCTKEPGYMGSVTVYSPEKKAVYKWYCAKQRLISAAVSPDGKLLAVLTDEHIRLFSLDSETERGSFECSDLQDIVWLGERVCGIGDSGAYVYDDKGKAKGRREFSGRTTGKFGVLDKKLIIEVREHAYGGMGDVYILDDSLDINNRISPDGEVWHLDCRNKKIAILTQKGVNVYSDKAKLMLSESVSGAREVLLIDNGDVIAVGGGSVWNCGYREMNNS